MSGNPYESPDAVSGSQVPRPRRRALRLIELLAVVAVIGVLVAMLLPARRHVGEAAQRAQCSNNLKQIALALANYEAEYHAFPPAYTVDGEGRPLHSWRTLILPFLEQQSLYGSIDFTKPWNDAANQAACETNLDVFQCPSVTVADGHTTYLAVLAPGGCLRPGQGRALREIVDGTSNTLVIVDADAAHAVPWMSPTDVDEAWLLSLSTAARLPHRGGIQVALADGTVRFIAAETKPEVLRALVSIGGNDNAALEQD